MYSYDDVEGFRSNVEGDIKSILARLEDDITNARDHDNLPVYLTKYRIKSLNSLYLKTKRKNKPLEEVTDIGGFRVLCLFEQDIFDANSFLCSLLKRQGFKLLEFKLFNWRNEDSDDSGAIASLRNSASVFGSDFESTAEDKSSGYKSIHFVLSKDVGGGRERTIEIQLRTLLQDVWAELEHALAYKQGSIHPHIKKNFHLFARDLQTKDMLLSHLKEVYENERTIELFGLHNAGPYRVFSYENDCIPKIFQSGERKELYDTYMGFVLDESNKKSLPIEEWEKQARNLCEAAIRDITYTDYQETTLKYWHEMEKAYIDFASFNLDKALDAYQKIGDEHKDKYVTFFRKGEILFIQGNIEAALVAFDRAEQLLISQQKHDLINEYRIKIKLANIYWLLGAEYFPLAVEKCTEAKNILLDNRTAFEDSDERSMWNNLCYYQLERFLITNEEGDFNAVDETFTRLEQFIDSNDISSNALDTAAWFLYQKFRKTGTRSYLDRAKVLCRKSWSQKKANATTNIVLSMNIHRNHIHTIMGA